MAQIDFKQIFEELKSGVFNLAEVTVKKYVSEAKEDGLQFLESIKVKLERWTMLLANGDLTTEDFEWLVFSQEQLGLMLALKNAGLAEIRIDQFKGSVINLISDTIFSILKIVL